MSRKYQYKTLLQNILEEKEKYAEELMRIVNQYLKLSAEERNKSKETFIKKAQDVIWRSLEKTYSKSLIAAKEIYGLSLSKKLKLENLVWDNDEIALNERIAGHFDIIISLHKRLLLLLDNETRVIHNRIIRNSIEGYYPYAEVINDDCCDDCEIYFREGRIPIEKLELPPYHPDCECYVIYYENLGEENNVSD